MNLRSILSNTRGAVELTHSGIAASVVGLGVVTLAVVIFLQTIASMS